LAENPVKRSMYRIDRSPDSELDKIGRADLARLCYSCGICVGDCPAARFSEDFNPRQIFLKVCLGIGEGLVGEDSPIWKCTTCYTCYERCPAGVKPLDVILALRNLSYARNSCPEGLKTVRAAVLSSGRVAAVTGRIRDLRGRMGLPDLPEDGGGPGLKGLVGED
jgi:heterodisulfide reductase subunit C